MHIFTSCFVLAVAGEILFFFQFKSLKTVWKSHKRPNNPLILSPKIVIGSSTSLIFDSLFQPRSGCTVSTTVPLSPYDPYYKAELFPSLDAKLAANQNRFDRNLRQGKVATWSSCTTEHLIQSNSILLNSLTTTGQIISKCVILVWVDSPDPSICGYGTFQNGGRCCLNGHFPSQYEWTDFASGEKKKIANEQLWADAQRQGLPFYKGNQIRYILKFRIEILIQFV